MEQARQYSYSLDGEQYYGIFDSVEEALEEARAEATEYPAGEIDSIYIGEVCSFEPGVDAFSVIESIQNDAYDEAGELAYDYLEDISDENLSKLQDMLTEVFKKWARETHNEPNFSIIGETKIYSLGAGEYENSMLRG